MAISYLWKQRFRRLYLKLQGEEIRGFFFSETFTYRLKTAKDENIKKNEFKKRRRFHQYFWCLF